MNFKKQVMRYRLKADQKIGRANKSEVLNDELLQIEKRLDHTRSACMSVYKRISQCQQSSGSDLDKRLKKLPETAMANAMLEASNQLLVDSDSALQKSLKVCADAQSGIARERAMYELFVEGYVITPLHTLVEVDIPNIQKIRDRLKRLVLDRDNAHSAWQKAHKSQYSPGVNMQQMSVKADAMKDELDAAISRMEQCKDTLITELYDFLAKEGTYAQHMTDFVDKELDYHKKCVNLLEKLKPDLDQAKVSASAHSSYGTSLSEHLRVTEREIAAPIESCIQCLLEIGIYEEGLFRVAGGAAKLKKFRALAGAGVMDLISYDAHEDIHAVAGTLKHYLRELPDPLLTQELHSQWIASASIKDNDGKLQEIWSLINQLPKENKSNLGYLIRFCNALASKLEYNKMSPGNIALVLAPNLLWASSDDITSTMMISNSVAGIIECMINFPDYFFPDVRKFEVPSPPMFPDKSLGHLRTPSSGSTSETSGPAPQSSNNGTSTNLLSTTVPSSSETASLNENTIQRAKKKKAPPAPTSISRNNGLMTAGTEPSPGTKPPVATKRASSKRPSMPPPARPNTSVLSDLPDKFNTTKPVRSNPISSQFNQTAESNTKELEAISVVKPAPNPKPRVPAKKQPSSLDDYPTLGQLPVKLGNPSTEHYPLIPEAEEPYFSGGEDDLKPNSYPPMLDFTLPPPPEEILIEDLCGHDLSSELAQTSIIESPKNDEDEVQVTQL